MIVKDISIRYKMHSRHDLHEKKYPNVEERKLYQNGHHGEILLRHGLFRMKRYEGSKVDGFSRSSVYLFKYVLCLFRYTPTHNQSKQNTQVQLATSAVEILSRRAQIAKLLRDSHTEMLENIHNVDLKELEEEERSMSSFKVTPRDLLKRDEQREGMKQFVRLVESRIANETDTLISMKPVLEPLPDAHRLIAMRTCVTRLETSDRKWGELFEDIGLSVKDRNLDVCTSNLINTTRDVCKETLSLHRKFQRLLMDSRTVRGETLRNCCGIVRKMYV